ncbi:MAG TPA: NIPSNAP family protein [Mucilaginibacter sp.]|nr:NIPSNAP family protein [Mucilaginibacter sp.]
MRLRIIVLLAFFALMVSAANATEPPRCYYQIWVYHYKTANQEAALDNYFKNALKPALRRAGTWETGFFKTIEKDTDKRFYVLITFPHKGLMDKLQARLKKDKIYQEAAKDYFGAPYNDPPYTRMEMITLYAFPQWRIPGIPKLSADKPDRIYELRSYESPTEKYHENKIKMFNTGGEVWLFSKLRFNAVFYGDVLQGSHMPNLMYMTAFENMDDRNKHWDAFFNSPDWKALIADKQYDHNVSKADIIFLHPTEYSDF